MRTSCTASGRSKTSPHRGRISFSRKFTGRPAASPMAHLLEVDGVTLQYRAGKQLVTATRRVSFHVSESDRFVILGPSGCGKSTLLKAVGGYVKPVEGSILLNG